MDSTETQVLKDTETSNFTSGTLVYNENQLPATIDVKKLNDEASPNKDDTKVKSPSIIKNFKKAIVNNKVEKNGEQPTLNLSNYCLRLNTQNQLKHVLDGPVTILPLFIGLNTIGRSNENTICILNKNLSKEHACIELIQKENGDLDDCLVWDVGSLNKTKTTEKKEGLEKCEKYSLKLNESIQFGIIRFDLVKMTESQFKEQELKPVKQVELDDILFNYSAKKLNKSNTNGSSKLAKIVDIPNTLDDTYLVETNDSEKEKTNSKNLIFVSDTEPEDNEDDYQNTTDFHLEMSASIINQSAFSTNQSRTSFVVPDTLVSRELEENSEKKEEPKIVNGTKEEPTNENSINGSENIENTTETTPKTVEVTPTATITTTDDTMITVPETIIICETQTTENQIEEASKEKIAEPCGTEIKSSTTELKKLDEKNEPDVVNEPSLTINGTKEIIKSKEETLIQTELKTEEKIEFKSEKSEEPIKSTNEKSIIDESITINDDDDEIKKVETESEVLEEILENKNEPNAMTEEINQDKEVVIESTLLENGDDKLPNSSNISIVANIDEIDQKIENNIAVNETTKELNETVDIEEATESVKTTISNRRSRKSKTATKPTESEEANIPSSETTKNETSEKIETERSTRRSTRVSIVPTVATTSELKSTRTTRAKKTNEIVQEKNVDTEKKVNQEVEKFQKSTEKEETSEGINKVESKEQESNQPGDEKKPVTEKKEEEPKNKKSSKKTIETSNETVVKEAEESKLGRRSSLRIRNNVQNSASLAREKLIKQAEEKKAKSAKIVEEPTISKRKKSLEPATLAKSNKRLKNQEQEESYHADEEEDEEAEKTESSTEETTKSKTKSRKSKVFSSSAKATIEEEDEKEVDEKEKAVKIKRTYSRRKTIAVDSNDLKEASTKKNVDTYLYEESSENDHYQEKKGGKKRSNVNLSLVESTKNDSKRKKNKTNEVDEPEVESTTNKRGRKRKSNDPKSSSLVNQDSEEKQTTTPKLFFHSKNRNKTTDTPSKSDVDSSTTSKKNTTVNKPTYSAALNNSKVNTSLNTSACLSPSKKFKLLKAKSSSSENLNNTITSSDDDDQVAQVKEKTINKKNVSFSEPKIEINDPKKDEVVEKTEGAESSIVPPMEESLNEITTIGKKQSRLNVTLKEKPIKPVKETAKTRLSLQPTTSAPTRQTSRNLKGQNAVKIMTTGILLTEKQQKTVNDLGGQIVSDVNECTHLITNKIRKTYKFLSCLNRSTYILNERWLDECSKTRMFSNLNTFGLKDTQFEKQHKFSLQTSLNKAKSNPLFKDWKFKIECKDNDPEMTVDNIKTIIECGGGEVSDSLPENQQDLDQFCIIYDDMEAVNKNKNDSNKKIIKILLDVFLNCILKQSFDSLSFIQMNESD